MNSSNPQRRVPATTAVLATLCAMSFIMYVDRTNIATAALAIRSDLGLNNSQLGFVFSAFAMTYSLAMIPGSWIGDKVGAHKMLAICGVLWAIGTLLTGFAGGLVSLIAARFLVGLGESPIVPTSARALAAWTRPERRGFAQGITHSFARLGNASTPIIVVSLIAATSWRVAFIVLGLASLVWVAWWIWYYRDDPTQHAGITAKELTLLPGRAITARPPMRWAPLLKTLWPATMVSFCHGWALWFFLNWMPSYFSQTYHLNLKNSAYFSSGVFLGGVIGTTLGGWASDLILKKTGDVRRARRTVIVFGFLSPLVFLVPLFMGPSVTVAAICLTMALFLSELMTAPLWAVAMDLAPRHAATSAGIMNTGLALAGAISPPLVGWIIDHSETWHPVFGLTMFFLCLGPILAIWIRPDRPYMGEPEPVELPVGGGVAVSS
jgi:MFS family permease